MGLIGRRCTAVMPSRPVLIGRGLVPTTYTTTHTRTHNEHSSHACSRPLSSSQPTNTPHPPRVGVCEVERVTAAIAKRETPGPIPNPEVKPFSADGTATERLWESRTPPDIHCGSGVTFGWPHFCISWWHSRAQRRPLSASRSCPTKRPQAAPGSASPQGSARVQSICRHDRAGSRVRR